MRRLSDILGVATPARTGCLQSSDIAMTWAILDSFLLAEAINRALKHYIVECTPLGCAASFLEQQPGFSPGPVSSTTHVCSNGASCKAPGSELLVWVEMVMGSQQRPAVPPIFSRPCQQVALFSASLQSSRLPGFMCRLGSKYLSAGIHRLLAHEYGRVQRNSKRASNTTFSREPQGL